MDMSRHWFLSSYILLLIVLFLQIYTASLEGKSKINPQSSYTTWFFGPYLILNLGSVIVYTMVFMPKGVIVYIDVIQKNSLFTSTLCIFRMINAFLLWLTTLLCFKNFNLQFNMPDQGLTTSLLSRSKRC